jgi:hypothetical protein
MALVVQVLDGVSCAGERRVMSQAWWHRLSRCEEGGGLCLMALVVKREKKVQGHARLDAEKLTTSNTSC